MRVQMRVGAMLLALLLATTMEAHATNVCLASNSLCGTCKTTSVCATCKDPTRAMVDKSTGRCRLKTCTELDGRCKSCEADAPSVCAECWSEFDMVNPKTGKCDVPS
ncbi:extracellular matrix FRAS1 [Micractinium conductrix]|uniref:Extracellular matrix FRAS1 n=1 Tax=Micractinium conductrix TaxID=554055 RepID=A0A2P6UZ53_9CHLO|nr:extracellular matrix FRAS1 [Micractinium conductrix]|eukprot:PSC67113.1 extracellular matrix FRAS1 [Micractinium conductrix]